MEQINIADQLYVNNKWYFDVVSVNSDIITVRIKYVENPKTPNIQLYREIALDKEYFKDIKQNKFIKYCTIDNTYLKSKLGSLIDRIVKETDILNIFEEVAMANGANTSGMSAVIAPTMSGTPGIPGQAGSGDISNNTFPKNSIGFEINPPYNKKVSKNYKKKSKGKAIIKQPLLTLNDNNISDIEDTQYKKIILDILDYPADNEYDIKFIKSIEKIKPIINNTSIQILKKWFKDLYTFNKTIIDTESSEWFQNNLQTLIENE